jgi:hypothetical protein
VQDKEEDGEIKEKQDNDTTKQEPEGTQEPPAEILSKP